MTPDRARGLAARIQEVAAEVESDGATRYVPLGDHAQLRIQASRLPLTQALGDLDVGDA